MKKRFSKKEKEQIRNTLIHALDILASDYDHKMYQENGVLEEILKEIELAQLWILKTLK